MKTLNWKGKKAQIAEKIIKEIRERLSFLVNVGLNYLTVDRKADSLSGGEAQRIRLASQIGAGFGRCHVCLGRTFYWPTPT